MYLVNFFILFITNLGIIVKHFIREKRSSTSSLKIYMIDSIERTIDFANECFEDLRCDRIAQQAEKDILICHTPCIRQLTFFKMN